MKMDEDGRSRTFLILGRINMMFHHQFSHGIYTSLNPDVRFLLFRTFQNHVA